MPIFFEKQKPSTEKLKRKTSKQKSIQEKEEKQKRECRSTLNQRKEQNLLVLQKKNTAFIWKKQAVSANRFMALIPKRHTRNNNRNKKTTRRI